ncbi:MAG: FmdB family zinc ribbon protein [Candidatus Dormibacteria bacterium]
MPVYEYFCSDCRGVFEVLRPIADRQLAAVCPLCESRDSMPLISRVALTSGSADMAMASGGGGDCACGGACSCAN